jgi:hypothetical protein
VRRLRQQKSDSCSAQKQRARSHTVILLSTHRSLFNSQRDTHTHTHTHTRADTLATRPRARCCRRRRTNVPFGRPLKRALCSRCAPFASSNTPHACSIKYNHRIAQSLSPCASSPGRRYDDGPRQTMLASAAMRKCSFYVHELHSTHVTTTSMPHCCQCVPR